MAERKEEEEKKEINDEDEDVCENINDTENDENWRVDDDDDDDDENWGVDGNENWISDDDNDDDDDDNDNNDILKSLLLFNEYKKKQKQKNDKEFLPSLQIFFKANVKKSHRLFNKSLQKKIEFLAANILNRKIPIECSREYRYVLHKIVKKKIDQTDLRILMCEDQCTLGVFEKALKLIKKSRQVK